MLVTHLVEHAKVKVVWVQKEIPPNALTVKLNMGSDTTSRLSRLASLLAFLVIMR
jgi:hypothetical protein